MLSADGSIPVQTETFSNNGSLLAYGLSKSGSDWIKMKVRNVETGEDFSDLLEDVKFTVMAWSPDDEGFFYGVRQL